ncbi:sigma-70 family RNA polymerase sigma factor [Kibdelosporangium philippinense]|uniref:Sigma-70 family RNA polymerase sigma factor n=1 Tax=Kibdelosporangium philippinense TaxID=211113 RepID=A0ABS8ZB31_9PSEU|nr:sigma-70 family RNA polymerase sigma factor [Kibdelosporangium philippinense]MCE7004243.1 sigma-70 family RNA polymerase sigma factor [Kibdelosporangium philippinense]
MIVVPSDVELVFSAKRGTVEALGLLLARHEAGMRAVALSILGYGPDVDDVIQDASLIALRRIGDLRDPAAIGPWLKMIVRNECRMRLRRPQEIPFDGADLRAGDAGPDKVIEQHALRDWIWHAMGELSPKLRLPLMLRHFTGVTSYDQIAAACEVPVGTVRSRLNQASAKLAAALQNTAEQAHDDAAKLTVQRRNEGIETLEAAEKGRFAEVVAGWSPRMELSSGPLRGGADFVIRGMDGDLADGVRQRMRHTVASKDVTIWEMDMINPPDDPFHCPPAVVWLMTLEDGRPSRIRLIHPVTTVTA